MQKNGDVKMAEIFIEFFIDKNKINGTIFETINQSLLFAALKQSKYYLQKM